MSILITGANGLVGKDLVHKLSNKYKIFAIYRTKSNKVKNIKNVKWIKHNLNKEFNKKIKPIPKYIIHCAVDQKYLKENNIFNYINSNILVLKNIVNFAKQNKVKLIINLSSVEVYGDVSIKLIDENYKPKNPNKYGFTKFLSEKILSQQKVNFINIRLPGVLCEPSKHTLSRPWLNNVFEKMKKNKIIFVHNLKGKFNNVITSSELSKFITFLIKKNILIRDTFNFTCSKPALIEELIYKAKKKLNSRSKIDEITNHKKNSFYISTKKIEKKLNYKTQSTKKILEQYLENFIKYKRA